MRPSGTDDGTNQGMAARCFRAFSLHTNAISATSAVYP